MQTNCHEAINKYYYARKSSNIRHYTNKTNITLTRKNVASLQMSSKLLTFRFYALTLLANIRVIPTPTSVLSSKIYRLILINTADLRLAFNICCTE